MSNFTSAVAQLATQPILWWRMDAATNGAQANSGSGGTPMQGSMGSGVNGPAPTGGSPSLIVAGDSNAAISFSGCALPQTGDSVSASPSATTSLEFASNFSFFAIINATAINSSNGNIILSISDSAGNNSLFMVVEGSTGHLHSFTTNTGNVTVQVISSTVLTIGNTYVVCFTYDGATYRQYINGAIDPNTTAATSSVIYSNLSAGIFAVGGCPNSGYYSAWNGPLDEIIVCNYVLTPQQILSLSSAALKVPFSPNRQRAPILAQ